MYVCVCETRQGYIYIYLDFFVVGFFRLAQQPCVIDLTEVFLSKDESDVIPAPAKLRQVDVQRSKVEFGLDIHVATFA